jgi:hypothetical protein
MRDGSKDMKDPYAFIRAIQALLDDDIDDMPEADVEAELSSRGVDLEHSRKMFDAAISAAKEKQ